MSWNRWKIVAKDLIQMNFWILIPYFWVQTFHLVLAKSHLYLRLITDEENVIIGLEQSRSGILEVIVPNLAHNQKKKGGRMGNGS